MAKLYFRHGPVGSAKTLNLLAVAHNYRQQGKKVILVKPEIDTRWGKNIIKSRAGLEKTADVILPLDGKLNFSSLNGVSCVIVDESQFFTKNTIDHLRSIPRSLGIPVICYGLRTDFRTNCFEGSKRLLEVADSIEEIKMTCYNCEKKAIFNLKHVNGKPTKNGPTIDLGAEEKYLPVCDKCYHSLIEASEFA